MIQKKRVFVYIRVSTREQAVEGYSIGEQEERLTKYCDAMEWNLVKTYIDPGYSGSNMERPALQEMIREIGNTDIVLVDKLDRLSRSQFDTLYLIKKVFNANNVAFVSRAEAFDTSSSFGRAMVGILAVFAELERERIKERMIDGKEGRAKDGKFKGGEAPIGFDYDISTGSLVINEYEALQVSELFDLYNKRMPYKAIAKELNKKGYRTKHGEWQAQTVRNLISNPVYIGKISHKGTIYDGLHDAIVDEKVYNKAQEIKRERNRSNDKYRPGKCYNSPLGGLVWCGHCNSKYQWKTSGYNKDGSKRAYYSCYSRTKSDKNLVKDPNCKNKTYRDRDLENIIYTEIRNLKSDSGYINALQDNVDTSGKQKEIQKRINQISGQISKLMDLYALDNIDLNTIKSKITPLTSEKKSLESELEILKKPKSTLNAKDVINLVDMLDQTMVSGDSSKTHDIIAEIIDHIIIDGENIKIHWRF